MHARQIIVLVFLYSISNVASYFALARVDASVYTVFLQASIYLDMSLLIVALLPADS
jgi:hypothetical protein